MGVLAFLWIVANLVCLGVFSIPLSDLPPNRIKTNADEIGYHFEGDIVLTTDQLISPYNGILDPYWRWENGVIPYVFGENEHTTAEKNIIIGAMNEVSYHTCITFVARTTQSDYIKFMNGNSGCWSYIGRIRGEQVVNLHNGGGCVSRGIAMHELLHSIGFFHAHSDVNRDSYIKILYENIIDDTYRHFQAYSNNYVSDFGEGYDYGSILHYGPYAFSKNGKVTIQPLATGVTIGQREMLSTKDINKVLKMYNCPTITTTTTTTKAPTTTTTTTKATTTTTTTKPTTTTKLVFNRLP